MPSDDNLSRDVRSRLRAGGEHAQKLFKGTARAFLASVGEVVGEDLPSVKAMAETNRSVLSETWKFMRMPQNQISRMTDRLTGSKPVRALQEAAKNAIDDLKTGNLYDPDRAFGRGKDSMSFGGFDFRGFNSEGEYDLPDDSSFSFDLPDAISKESSMANERTNATIGAMGTATEVIVDNNNMNYNRNLKMSIQQHSQVMSAVTNMVTQQAATAKAVADFSRTYMDLTRESQKQIVSGMEDIKKVLEDIRKAVTPKEEQTFTTTRNDIYNSDGVINIKNYAKHVARQVDEQFLGGTVGLVNSVVGGQEGIVNAIQEFSNNPWQAIMKGAIRAYANKTGLSKQMKITNANFEGFIPALLAKFADRGDRRRRGEKGSGLLDQIAGVFGYRETSYRPIVNNAIRDPMAQATLRAKTLKVVEDVIPMWLSKIYSALSGEPEKIFDIKQGKMRTVASVVARESRESLSSMMGDSGRAFFNGVNDLQFSRVKDQDEFRDFAYRWIESYANYGYLPSPNMSYEEFERKAPGLLKVKKDTRRMYYRAVVAVLKTMKRSDLMNMTKSMANASRNNSRWRAELDRSRSESGIGMAFAYIDEKEQRMLAKKANESRDEMYDHEADEALARSRKERERHTKGAIQSTASYVRDIRNLLERGIVTYSYIMGDMTKGTGKGGKIKPKLTNAMESAIATTGSRQAAMLKDIMDDNAKSYIEERQMQEQAILNEAIKNGTVDTKNLISTGSSSFKIFRNARDNAYARYGNEADNELVYNPKTQRKATVVNDVTGSSNGKGVKGTIKDIMGWDDGRSVGGNILNAVKNPAGLMVNAMKVADQFMYKIIFGEDGSEVTDENGNVVKKRGLVDVIETKIRMSWMNAKKWFDEKIFKPIRDVFFGEDVKRSAMKSKIKLRGK